MDDQNVDLNNPHQVEIWLNDPINIETAGALIEGEPIRLVGAVKRKNPFFGKSGVRDERKPDVGIGYEGPLPSETEDISKERMLPVRSAQINLIVDDRVVDHTTSDEVGEFEFRLQLGAGKHRVMVKAEKPGEISTYSAPLHLEIKLGRFLEFGVAYQPHSLGGGSLTWPGYDGWVSEVTPPAAYSEMATICKRWQHPRIKETVLRDIKIMRYLGMKWVRIQLMPEDGREGVNWDDFLEWTIERFREQGIKIYLDIPMPEGWPEDDAGWRRIKDHWELRVRRFGNKVQEVQIDNEWVAYSGIDITEAVSHLKEMVDLAHRVCPHLKVAINFFDFPANRIKYLLDNGVSLDTVGCDPYMHYPHQMMPYLLRLRDAFADLLRAYPNVELMSPEFGWHQRRFLQRLDKPYYTSWSFEIGADWFGTHIDEMAASQCFRRLIYHWFNDAMVFRQRCHHFLTYLNRELAPEGRVVRQKAKKYTPPSDPFNQLDVRVADGVIRSTSETVVVAVTNTRIYPLQGTLHLEPPPLFKSGENDRAFDLKPGEEKLFGFNITLPDDLPTGVYHVFARAEVEGGSVYGMGIWRKLAPTLEMDVSASGSGTIFDDPENIKQFRFLRDGTPPIIVYDENASDGEMANALSLEKPGAVSGNDAPADQGR